MNIKVELQGEKELQKLIKRLIKEKPKEVKVETHASGLDVLRAAKMNLKDMKAWDTGNAANSGQVGMEKAGFTAAITFTAPYAVYIEHGARPHFPPPDALEGWARRHGFDSTWPICLAIAKRGLPERPFLGPAYLKIRDLYFKRLTRIFST